MRRRGPALAGLLAALVAVAAIVRRGTARRRERADLYFGDGSMLSLASDSAEAQRLLPIARELLSAARQ